jgi:site-specific DNA-methyltransferase (adenine-specific)
MIQLLLGDCRERLKELPDCSVDSIVTDPPYELGFMGKSWDASGVAYDVTVWQECLRVLKHGGHLLSFGGSRTYHRMACAIEDAGFQIRDQIMWVYGSGFPKSLNISKAIDKAAGAEREVIAVGQYADKGRVKSNSQVDIGNSLNSLVTAPATAEAEEWDGWGTALKPAHEPIVLARKPLDGTVANNVLTHGTGGINIDGCRVGNEGGTAKGTFPNQESNGIYGDGLNGACEIKQLDACRFPANFIHDGSDEVVELFPDSKAPKPYRGEQYKETSMFGIGGVNHDSEYGDSGSAARFFYCAKASKKDRNEGLEGMQLQRRAGLERSDREGELDDLSERFRTQPSANFHPTVKPTDLMRYLCRLITPPNGTVLDPFTGSGSTGKAAVLEGFSFIGVEQSEEYIAIAKARIESATR